MSYKVKNPSIIPYVQGVGVLFKDVTGATNDFKLDGTGNRPFFNNNDAVDWRTSDHIHPTSSNTKNLGDATLQWANIHVGTAIIGNNVVDGDAINKTPTSGSQFIGASSIWIPPVGVYQMGPDGGGMLIYFEIYHTTFGWVTCGNSHGQVVYSDGANMRIREVAGFNGTVYYQKF